MLVCNVIDGDGETQPEEAFHIIQFSPLMLRIPHHEVPLIALVSFKFKAVRKTMENITDLIGLFSFLS